MPPTPAEATAIVNCILQANQTDHVSMGRIVYYLRLDIPTIAWDTYLTNAALGYQKWIDNGMDIQEWLDRVFAFADSWLP